MKNTNTHPCDSILEAALHYLKLGLHPIPVIPNMKNPLVDWIAYQTTQPTEAEIRKWFGRWPDANLAIVTGSASGLDVIDFDPGHDLWPTNGQTLPRHLVVKTPRGKHVYIKHIAGLRKNEGILGKGIDLRADGAVAIVPPSKIGEKSYYVEDGSFEEVLKHDPPEWLVDALLAPKNQPALKPSLLTGEPILEGQRNSFLTSLAGSMRRRGMSEEAMFAGIHEENLARCQPPLPEKEVRSIARSVVRYKPEAPEIPEPELSDAWNANQFVRSSRSILHYIPAIKSWFFWNGQHWERDSILFVEKQALGYAQSLWEIAGHIQDSKDRENWAKHVNRSQSRRGIDNFVYLARSVGTVPIRYEKFDTDTRLLNTESGVICFASSTSDTQLQDHKPEDLITKICPLDYDPEAKSELWDQFLRDSTDGNEDLQLFIQRCAGYSLVGENPEEKFFFIWGPAASGKSTFIEAIKSTIGNYAVSINASVFLSQRSSGGPQPEVIKIKGKRIVIASETEPGKKFNTDLIKSLSGRDTIGARDLYSKPIEFKFGGKLWVISNFAPKVQVEDEAFMRRIIVIPFNNSIPEERRDPSVKTILTNPKISGSAILNWMIQGYFNYLEVGLDVPDVIRNSLKEYKDEINPITDFVDECCELDPGNEDWQAKSGELYDAYTAYCERNKMKYPVNKNRFGRCLRQYGLGSDRDTIDGARVRIWVGIRLVGFSDA